jgi:transcriptional regulator with XRE-family HTH domain
MQQPTVKPIAPLNRLRDLRDRSRLTLPEVAKITGYDPTTISKYENRSRTLTDEAIRKFAALYKVQTHELFVL